MQGSTRNEPGFEFKAQYVEAGAALAPEGVLEHITGSLFELFGAQLVQEVFDYADFLSRWWSGRCAGLSPKVICTRDCSLCVLKEKRTFSTQ